MSRQDWRLWRCPRCGHTVTATHGRPSRRRLALVQAAAAHPWTCSRRLPERASADRTHAPGSTHDRTHAPLSDYVTHGTRTVITFDGISAGQGQSRSRHGTPAPGACTIPPPSLQGGIVRPHLVRGP